MSSDDDDSTVIILGKARAAVKTFATKPVFNVKRWHLGAIALVCFLLGAWLL